MKFFVNMFFNILISPQTFDRPNRRFDHNSLCGHHSGFTVDLIIYK